MINPGSSPHLSVKRKSVPHLKLVPKEHPLLSRRDPELIRRIYPALCWLVDRYFRTEVEGADNLSDKASLMVATHNGGMYTPDAYCLLVTFWRRFGLETPGYGMMHRAAFHIPLLGPLLTRLGAVHACQENAGIVLRHGHPLMVCPGGDLDALKPFSRRHEIVFGNRMGFISVAIRHQVPIVPIISVGAHEVFFFLNDGRWLARMSGFSRFFRIKTVPLSLSFPLGLTPAGLFSLPLPSKIRLRILPRIELDEPPESARDPRTIRRCFDHVRRTMQAALTDLASRRRFVLLG